MAQSIDYKETKIGVGDRIKVTQRIKEGDKERTQAFEGMLIAIKGQGETKTITVRRIGVQQVGIERIFAINSPIIEKIEVTKHGLQGARHAKLYFVRKKSKKEIDKIYSRATSRLKSS